MYQVELHIEMLEEGNYHTILYGTLGGIRMRIVLDTGASHSCIDAEIAHTLFPDSEIADTEGVNAGIGGSDFNVEIADFPDFTLGDYRQATLAKLAVVDMSHINVAYRTLDKSPIQMILGNDFLIEHEAVIDYGDKRLYFQ